MTIPVLIILGALWAAVLVPPLLRARSERQTGAIGDYTHTLGVLKSSNRRVTMARPAAGLVDASMHQESSKAMHIKKRRKDVFTALLASAGVTLVLAVFLGNGTLWALQILCDIALGAYVFLLIQIKDQQRMRREQPQPMRDQGRRPQK